MRLVSQSHKKQYFAYCRSISLIADGHLENQMIVGPTMEQTSLGKNMD